MCGTFLSAGVVVETTRAALYVREYISAYLSAHIHVHAHKLMPAYISVFINSCTRTHPYMHVHMRMDARAPACKTHTSARAQARLLPDTREPDHALIHAPAGTRMSAHNLKIMSPASRTRDFTILVEVLAN